MGLSSAEDRGGNADLLLKGAGEIVGIGIARLLAISRTEAVDVSQHFSHARCTRRRLKYSIGEQPVARRKTAA